MTSNDSPLRRQAREILLTVLDAKAVSEETKEAARQHITVHLERPELALLEHLAQLQRARAAAPAPDPTTAP